MTRSRTRSTASRPGLHPDRAARGDRHHRRPDRPAAARRCRRRARPPAGPSAPTTSSRSAWRCTTTRAPTARSRRAASRRISTSARHLATSQFVDGGWSTLARILPYMEGGTSFNALNFNLAEYNDACGSNYTGASQVIAVFLCPSSTRSPDGGRDGVDPNDPFSALGNGYGYNDYGPTVYTDISPIAVGPAQRREAGRPTATRSTRPTACSSRVRHGSPRSPTAPATPSPSPRTPVAIPVTSAPTPRATTTASITRQAAMATDQSRRPGPGGRLHALSPLLALGRAR